MLVCISYESQQQGTFQDAFWIWLLFFQFRSVSLRNGKTLLQVGETLLKMVVEDSQVPIQTQEPQVPIQMHDNLETESLGSDLNKNKISGVLCTPAVRHLAKQYGISLNDVQGTGKDGRVLKQDILKHAVLKGIIEDSSGIDLGDQLQREEASYSLSAEVGQHHSDETVPLR